MHFDFCVIGGGIVGLAVARALLHERPGSRLVLLEKESRVGTHQTARNSGVIHSGIYYAPGSLKARLSREGCEETKAYCRENGIPYEECGKLLVATDEIERDRMAALYSRSIENGVPVDALDAKDLTKVEPNIAGLGALRISSTSIVNYGEVCRMIAREISALGAEIWTGTRATAIMEEDHGVRVEIPNQIFHAEHLVACAGLQSDRVARLSGLEVGVRIVPFKGEYFRLPAEKNNLTKHLIYPIPDPSLPFLGIHITRMIDGGVTVGPNAVLALNREGYGKHAFNLTDATAVVTYPGFWRLVGAHARTTFDELANSLNRKGYLEQCRKYCPSLELTDLLPYPSGIRAQAVRRDGTLIHDFEFARSRRMLHVLNAPSPAATAALPIGRMVAKELLN
jgi:L-2-hydroxyglutarate oxidase